MQWRFSLIALWIKTAATVESTPPERPRITLSSPTFSLISEIVFSEKTSGVQSGFILAILIKNFLKYAYHLLNDKLQDEIE